MFDSDRPDQYEAVYDKLVTKLAGADLEAHAASLGLEIGDDSVHLPMLGGAYVVDRTGARRADGGPVDVSHRIVLGHLLIHGGSGEPAKRFVPYRELPGGLNFARNMAVTVEGRLAEKFTGRVGDIKRAAEALGGVRTDPGTSCDAAYVFEALPKIPLMFTFYDADDDFPAEAKLFYDAEATVFLDLECLAVLGSILVVELLRASRMGEA